jgi:hypothetical protein
VKPADKWLASAGEWLASADEWLRPADEWLRPADEWLASADEWPASADEWLKPAGRKRGRAVWLAPSRQRDAARTSYFRGVVAAAMLE